MARLAAAPGMTNFKAKPLPSAHDSRRDPYHLARAVLGRSKVAARGIWTDDDTYTVKLCFYETPFVETVTYRFSGDQVTINARANVGFGPTERPPVVGRLA